MSYEPIAGNFGGLPNYGNGVDRPLFGATPSANRIGNMVLGVVSALFVAETFLMCFISPNGPLRGLNIFFGFCIVFFCTSHMTLIYWYRQGDVDPKFLYLIYYNTVMVFMFCISANFYAFLSS